MSRIHLVLFAAELAAHSSVVAEIYGEPISGIALQSKTNWEKAKQILLKVSEALVSEDGKALQEGQESGVFDVVQQHVTFSAADMHIPAPSSNTTMSMRMKMISSNPVIHHIEYNGMYNDEPWHWFQTFTPHPNSPIYEHGGNPFACNEVTYTSGEKNKYPSDDGDEKFWDTDCCAYDPTDNESNGPLTPHTPSDTFYGSCVPGFTVKRGDRGCGYEGNKLAIYSTICIRNEENDIVIEELQTIEEALKQTGDLSRIGEIAEWMETQTNYLNDLVQGLVGDPSPALEHVTSLRETMDEHQAWLRKVLDTDIPAAIDKGESLQKLLTEKERVMGELAVRLSDAESKYNELQSKISSFTASYDAIVIAITGPLVQLEAVLVQVEATFVVVVEPSCEDKLADSEQATQECETEKGGLNLGSARMMKEIGDLSAKLEQCGSELTKAEESSYKEELNECTAEKGKLEKDNTRQNIVVKKLEGKLADSEECSYKGELNECKAEKGKLKQDNVDLVKELGQCGSELTEAEGKLATTADKLQKCARESAQCNSDKAKCTSDKAKCAEDLVARTNELRECNDDLQNVETEVGEAYNHIVDFEFSEARDRLVDAKEVFEEPSCRLQTTDETEGVVGYHQVGAYGADISGCGMQKNCDDRYDTKSEQECATKCDDMSECVAFTYAPLGGDRGVPEEYTVCTLYDSNVPTQTWTNSAGEGVQVFCARNEESSTTTTTTTTMRAEYERSAPARRSLRGGK